ncbi:MAG: hypothetical protein ACI9EZ_000346 [Halobacteriales archaeon]|jgi:hypothetical protein
MGAVIREKHDWPFGGGLYSGFRFQKMAANAQTMSSESTTADILKGSNRYNDSTLAPATISASSLKPGKARTAKK